MTTSNNNNLKLQKLIDTKEYVRLFRTICGLEESIKGFILAMSNSHLLIQPDEDFMLDGFFIVENKSINNIICNSWDKTKKKIIKSEGLLNLSYDTTDINLTNWVAIFKSIKKLDFHVIVESEENGRDYINFFIGPIKSINNNSVSIHSYDPNGKFEAKATTIIFDNIKSLKFADRYSTTFRKYLRKS